MGKCTQKLLVYLDQNLLSEMSKADIDERVRPEFKDIYELLHHGAKYPYRPIDDMERPEGGPKQRVGCLRTASFSAC